MSIKINPLTGSVGSLAKGINLSGPINDAQFAVLREAFLDDFMPVFRSQDLEAQAQIKFDAAQPAHPSTQPDAWDGWKACRDVA
jgi:alpha-ketoglutarate-dependent taurine dioxygenase